VRPPPRSVGTGGPFSGSGWHLGYEERRCWTIIVGQLISKISNLCDVDPPTLQTDGQADDMQSQYRTLHYCIVQVQRAVIIFLWPEGSGHHFNFLNFYKVITGNGKAPTL